MCLHPACAEVLVTHIVKEGFSKIDHNRSTQWLFHVLSYVPMRLCFLCGSIFFKLTHYLLLVVHADKFVISIQFNPDCDIPADSLIGVGGFP